MKNVLLLVASLLIVWVVWNVIKGLFFGLFGMAFQILLIGLFCYAVYTVYRALNRQKIT